MRFRAAATVYALCIVREAITSSFARVRTHTYVRRVRWYTRKKSDGMRTRRRGKAGEERERPIERESNISAHTFIGSMGIYWSGY